MAGKIGGIKMNNDIRKLIDDNWEDIKELIAQKAEAEQKTKTIWDIDINSNAEYYCLCVDGNIDKSLFSCYIDEDTRDIGNAFLTKEEAEFEFERRKVEAIMRKYGRLFKVGEENWYIAYHHDKKDFSVTAYSVVDYGVPYFESKEVVQKVIDEIGGDRLKKYWFGIKDE